ncbi:DJ-1/PfpI family protein [Planctomycetota bacterium]
MKRSTIFTVILLAVIAVCIGQPRKRVLPLQKIQLSEPVLTGQVSVERALASRRDSDRFTREQLSFTQLSQLAWAGQGIVDRQNFLRTAPSAQQAYPITLYFVTQQGTFIYDPEENSLQQTIRDDLRDRLAATVVNQQAVAEAGCDIIIAGSAKKVGPQYANQAKKNMILEAGHVAQNILLQAVSMELAAAVVWDFEARTVQNLAKFPKNLEAIHIISLGYPQKESESEKQARSKAGQKRAVLIIASNKFRDKELFDTQRQLEFANIETEIASSRTGIIEGILKGTADATVLLDDLIVDDYDAVIFIGGSGAREYFNDAAAWDIAREAFDKNKIIAAISTTPTILANAGLLNGVRVTSFGSERRRLVEAGANWIESRVERDGQIITAAMTEDADRFGRAIADALRD